MRYEAVNNKNDAQLLTVKSKRFMKKLQFYFIIYCQISIFPRSFPLEESIDFIYFIQPNLSKFIQNKNKSKILSVTQAKCIKFPCK